MAEIPLTDELPRDFGKYRLERRIATGGMAEVFLAHELDTPLEPLVIKRILPHLLKTGDFLQMFLDEARIAAQLRHENVVGIVDVGQVDGAYYLAMEYVHGEDIRRIYNRAYKLQRSLPLSHSIRVVADAALGLAHAHEMTDLVGEPMGLVHRDVSPQNILVTYDGNAKVVDFGIAKAANKVAETRAGVLKGKYSYMSPEQALGEGIDHRTDIFALGIILYETTTGTRLFKRENELATLQAIIKCEYLPPSEALQNYPPELEHILDKALAKRKEDRWPNGRAFSGALYDFLHESGLYVERTVIAEFMGELFEDRLAEERGSGQPALPAEHEVKEEMAELQTAAEGHRPDLEAVPSHFTPSFAQPEGVRAYTESESEVADLEAAVRAAGFTDPDDEGVVDSDATQQGAYHEGLEVPEAVPPSQPPQPLGEASDVNALAERRKSTYVVRRTIEPSDTVMRRGPDTIADPTPDSDEAPTVAVASYRPAARPKPPPKLEAKPSRQQRFMSFGSPEPTMREPRPAELHPSHAASGAGKKSSVPTLWLAAAAIMVVVAVLTGVLLSRWLAKSPSIEPEPAVVQTAPAPSDPLPPAGIRVTIYTEPGAEVFASGESLGRADDDGTAGPFEVDVGDILLRVAHPGTGFERSRSITVQNGQNYQVEIPGRHGWLRVAVAPWARVRIDGKDMGLTPLPKLTLFEGVHEVELVNPDISRRYKGIVRIIAGREAALKVDLQKSGERL